MKLKLLNDYFSNSNKYTLRFLVISPFIFLLLFILLSSLLTPYFETRMLVAQYEWFNELLGKICHQYPSRSFYVFGSNMGLCARCFSVYLGMLVFSLSFGFMEINARWMIRLIIGIGFCVPLIIDGTTQFYQLRISTNSIRLVTGLFAGLGIGLIWVPDYISSFMNVFRRLTNCGERG